jgi:hypothetical protein
MHHFVSYDKKTGEITGYFRMSSNELMPEPTTRGEAFLEVEDPRQIEKVQAMESGRAVVRGKVRSGKLQQIRTESAVSGRIAVEVEAKDLDGDGILELPADGTTKVTLRVVTYDEGESVLKDSVPVRFRVTGGTLSRRDVETKDGKAEVQLTTSTETIRCDVFATSSRFESVPPVALEFIPPEEFQELQKQKKRAAASLATGHPATPAPPPPETSVEESRRRLRRRKG